MFVCLPDFFSKSAQCETIVKITLDSVSDSSIWIVSIFPEYNNIGSDIKELLSSNKPLKISTLSLTTFSLRQVDINVWSAPDKAKFKLVNFISYYNSIPIYKAPSFYILLFFNYFYIYIFVVIKIILN